MLRQRTGSLANLGDALDPGEPFALLVAEAFDKGMTPDEWFAFTKPGVDPALGEAVRGVWHQEVLLRFAAAYGLTI